MKLGSSILDELTRKIDEVLPDDLKKGRDRLEKNVRAAAESVFQRLDLVTRKEFDVQSEMLAQSQLRVKELEQRVQELEGKETK
ncbi:MAG: accessory factor UbiK family protein [Gammaproteobacteria bacterium]|nr:accessory factor UbiK family protein [Gammaproteobacteria bacterium]